MKYILLILPILLLCSVEAESAVKTIRDDSCELFVITGGTQYPASVVAKSKNYKMKSVNSGNGDGTTAVQSIISDIQPTLAERGYTVHTTSGEDFGKMDLSSGDKKYLLMRISEEPEATMNGYYGGVARVANGLIKRISISRVVERTTQGMKERHWDSTFFADICYQDPVYRGESGELPSCRSSNNFIAMAKDLPICVKVSNHDI